MGFKAEEPAATWEGSGCGVGALAAMGNDGGKFRILRCTFTVKADPER